MALPSVDANAVSADEAAFAFYGGRRADRSRIASQYGYRHDTSASLGTPVWAGRAEIREGQAQTAASARQRL
jgi:hypothetical protein